MPALHLAKFGCDVTPPLGHPLCGGWIEPVRLLGPSAPIVICAVDWCGIRNDAHWVWREALAQAAHTTPERVAVQCVHPHNAPFADLEAQKCLDAVPGGPLSLDRAFFSRAVAATADALRESLKKTDWITQVGTGRARVEQVASNRRILGPDGKVRFTRTSATKDARVRAEPEGLIDPWLRTLSFWEGDRPVAALHYYATHPMSYYGDGRVSSDFCGLARDKFAEETKFFQVYFTGCAGNVTAGKYNNGAHEHRAVLRDRVLAGMRAAWQACRRQPLPGWQWRVEPIALLPRREPAFDEANSRMVLENPKATKSARGNAAFQLAWLKRCH
jgi:hypothetical protein